MIKIMSRIKIMNFCGRTVGMNRLFRTKGPSVFIAQPEGLGTENHKPVGPTARQLSKTQLMSWPCQDTKTTQAITAGLLALSSQC